jgi:hypothetical protein
MPAWPQQQGYSVEPQVAYQAPPMQHYAPQPQFAYPNPPNGGQPWASASPTQVPHGHLPPGYPHAAAPPGYPSQPPGYPSPSTAYPPNPPGGYSPQQAYAPSGYPPQQPYVPSGYPPQPAYGYGPTPGYPAPQIIYVQSVGYPQPNPTSTQGFAGHASWVTEGATNGFGEMPDMPGGWYQPPSNEELVEMNRGGPPVPMGAGAGGSFMPTFIPGLPSADPLVSHDFGSWVSKTFHAIGLSWKGLVTVNTLGLAATAGLLWAVSTFLRGAISVDKTGNLDATSILIPALMMLIGMGLTAMVGISATQAAAAFVVVADAEEGKGRLRLAQALSFGLRSVPRLLVGTLSTVFLMVVFTIAAGFALFFAIVPASRAAGMFAPFVVLVASFAAYCPSIYLFVATQTSMVGVASFETGSIVGHCRSRIRGHWWSMLARAMVVGAVIVAISVAVSPLELSNFIRTSNDVATVDAASQESLAVTFVVYVLAFCIQGPAQLVSYAELRSHVDGPAITALLAEKSM